MNIYEKIAVLADILGVEEDSLDPEIILDGMPQWNSATIRRLSDVLRKQYGFKLTEQRVATLTTVQDVLDLIG